MRKKDDNTAVENIGLRYWELALLSDPTRSDLYDPIIPLTNEVAQFHLCLKGVLELHDTAPARSAALYRQAIPLSPGNLLPHLARLSRLSETHPERPLVIGRLPLELQNHLLHALVSKAFQEIGELKIELASVKARALTPKDYFCLQKGPDFFSKTSMAIKADETIVLETVRVSGKQLQHAIGRHKDNETIVLAAVQQWGQALQFASERLRDNENIVRTAIEQNASLQWASERLRDDEGIVLVAFQKNSSSLQFASDRLRDHEDFFLGVIQKHGFHLQFASARLRDKEDVVNSLFGHIIVPLNMQVSALEIMKNLSYPPYQLMITY